MGQEDLVFPVGHMMQAIDVERFHSDLSAAIVAGVPIEIDCDASSRWRGKLTIAKLDELKKVLLANGESRFLGAFGEDPPPELPRRYWAAFQTFARTGSMLPVLDGLMAQRFAYREISHVLRWPFIYLSILLTCACAGLAFFSTRAAPLVVVMQADLRGSDASDLTAVIPWLLVILGGCLIALLLWMLVGGAAKSALWLGGRNYIHGRTGAMVLRLARMLMESGMPMKDAVSMGCDLTQSELRLRQNLEKTSRNLEEAGHLSVLAAYLTVSANQQLIQLRFAIPIALVTTLGGCIALVYCVMIFWPIISMFQELSKVGA